MVGFGSSRWAWRTVVGEKGNLLPDAEAASTAASAGGDRSLVEGVATTVYGGAVDVTTDVGSKLHEKAVEHAADHTFDEVRERIRRDDPDGDESDAEPGSSPT